MATLLHLVSKSIMNNEPVLPRMSSRSDNKLVGEKEELYLYFVIN